jgi:hypothetical protein
METEIIVCALCDTPGDIFSASDNCARCACELTKIALCTCHVFDSIETGSKVFIGSRITTLNPNCKVHG